MKIAIAGATGFVGSRLVERAQEEGHEILVFTRNPTKAQRVFPPSAFPHVEIVGYTPQESGEWQHELSGCDAVVNLAGTPLADERWTAERKRSILDSRKLGTRKLVEAIAQADPKPSVLVNSSAVGYYGTSETATFDETSPPGDDFLANVCREWEHEARQVRESGTRLAIVRTGIVLGMGGAIAKMLTPFRLFAGGPIGSGRQWFSWIHRDDLVNLILAALQRPEIEGVLDGTAPNPVRMKELCDTLGQVIHRPSWLPVPDFALHVLLGDAAQVVLEGQQVLPKRPLEYGFEYRYPTLKLALEEVLSSS
jgi:uncharacterized protein (TIGR01777 family)